LEDLRKSLQETFIEIPAGKSNRSQPVEFTDVLTGATVHVKNTAGKARLRVGEVLGSMPAVWLLGNQGGNANG
jgi:hypothetical protein